MTSTATPGSGAFPAADEAGRNVLDDTMIRFAHLERGRRDVLDASPIGVVMIDMHRNVRYANRAALDMLGLASYAGVTLESIFRDEQSKEVLRRQLEDRQSGFVGNYTIQGYRPDGRRIPLEITGLPIPDDHGVVVGSLGLFRNIEQQQLANKIHDLNRRVGRTAELLNGLAEALKDSFEFDRLSVAAFSLDRNHVNALFTYGHDDTVFKRWYYLNDDQKRWMMDPSAKVIPDLESFMEEPLWRRFRDDPAVRELLGAGIRSALRRDVRRGGDVLGSVTLMSRRQNGFSEEQRRIFEQLPIDATVLQALSFEEKQATAARLALLKALNRCTTLEDACDVLARTLVESFGWSHVSILRCDHLDGMIHLLAQHCEAADNPIRLTDHYQQPIDEGILGRVVKTRSVQNVPNVLSDRDYTPGVSSTDIRSELCVPVFAEDDKDVVRWIINVEDTRESAFAADEQVALEEVASQVGGLIHRISVLYVLTECFENASDPVFVTDGALRVRRANRAAAILLGFKDKAGVSGDLADFFSDSQARARLVGGPPGDLGEFVIRRVGERGADVPDASLTTIPVFLTRQDLPAGLTGSIFIARDTRAMRRTVELELLEKAAYEVAVETSSPLALAVCELEHIGRVMAIPPSPPATGPGSRDEMRRVSKVLRLLARVRHGYAKLAMFNPRARPQPSELSRLNLRAEIEALAADLSESDRVQVTVQGSGVPAINGDHFQLGTILEALLSELLRYAPESQPVEAALAVTDSHVTVRLRGFIRAQGAGSDAARQWSQARAELSIARPLIDEFMQFHRGEFGEATLPDQRTEFTLRFPTAAA
jgi:PAS domain S-box-containing protein